MMATTTSSHGAKPPLAPRLPPPPSPSPLAVVVGVFAIAATTACLYVQVFLGVPETIAGRSLGAGNASSTSSRFGGSDASSPAPGKIPTGLGLPVIVLGLPKTGTTSLGEYFDCAGLKSSHYECPDARHDGNADAWCGVCVKNNVDARAPPMRGCGEYDVWAQLDFTGRPNAGSAPGLSPGDVCFFPQISALSEISNQARSISHWSPYDRVGVVNAVPLLRTFPGVRFSPPARRFQSRHTAMPFNSASDAFQLRPDIHSLARNDPQFPDATFVLNRRRDVDSWIRSVDGWYDLRARLRDCDVPGLPRGAGAEGPEGDDALRAFVEEHFRRVRAFASAKPRHALVEVVIDDEDAGSALKDAFGFEKACWGRANANPYGGREEDVDGEGEDESAR